MTPDQARAITHAEQQKAPNLPMLVTGDTVAWVKRANDKTVGLSAVHRVYDKNQTYCQREIPGEEHRAGLAPLFASLEVCKRCARMYQQAMDAELEGRY